MSVNTVNASNYGPIFETTINKANNILYYCARIGHKVGRVYGYNVTPDHNNKLCVDFMHYGNSQTRDAIINYVLANYKQIGISGMISDGRVMGLVQDGSYRGPVAQWRTYHGPNPHTDHVHIQFTKAAMGSHEVSKPTSVPGIYTPPTRKSNAQIVTEVILGKWGNGPARADALTDAGYDAKLIQALVNDRLR